MGRLSRGAPAAVGRVWDHASVNGSPQRWSPYDIVIAISALAVLAGRYVPDRRAFTVPGYRQFLVALSAVSAVAVLVAGAIKPDTWNNLTGLPPNFSISVEWDYGAVIALGAAVVSAGIGIAAIRDAPAQPRGYRGR